MHRTPPKFNKPQIPTMDGRRRRFGHFRPIRGPQVEGPRYVERQPDPEKPPIQESQHTANPQKESPLYDGRIPPEIRNSIFQFALTEEDTTPYEVNNGYSRPGYTTKKKVNNALLQTCRRVYLETYHLPPITKEHVFWHPPETGPHGRFYSDRNGWEREKEMFTCRMMSWQLDLVKEIQIFSQEFWLEQHFPKFCEESFMQGIEKVKVTIRRCDWWWYTFINCNDYDGVCGEFNSSSSDLYSSIASPSHHPFQCSCVRARTSCSWARRM